MEKIIIPPDIKKVIRRNAFREFLIFLFTTLVFLLVGLALGFMFFKYFPQIVKYISFGIWMLIPIYKTKFPFKLFQKPYKGKIIDSTVKYVQKSAVRGQHGFSFRFQHYHLYIAVFLKIRKENGEISYVKTRETNSRLQHSQNTYKIGDSVLHVYGTKYIQVIPKNPSDLLICVVCGINNRQENEKCIHCNHTLKILK